MVTSSCFTPLQYQKKKKRQVYRKVLKNLVFTSDNIFLAINMLASKFIYMCTVLYNTEGPFNLLYFKFNSKL